MQNMIKDIWKNVDVMKAFDFTKSLDISEGVNPLKTSMQISGFQKNAFNNTYDMLLKIQDQSEKMVDLFMSNTAIPEEGRKILDEWKLGFKNGQVEIKKIIDDNFIKVESFFSGPTESLKSKSSNTEQKKSPEPQKDESEQKKELAKGNQEDDGQKKETTEKDKSIKEPQAKKNK